MLHYYVVTGQDKDSIHIADPDPGVKLTKLPRERFAEEWTGVTLFMAPSPDYKPHKDQKNGLLSFIPILVKQRGLIANIVLATLLVTLINIVGSYYLQSIIDTYVPDQMRSTLGIIFYWAGYRLYPPADLVLRSGVSLTCFGATLVD